MRPKSHQKLKEKKKKAAESQIEKLFLKAGEAFKKDSKAADRLVRKARRLAMKHKIKMPRKLKRSYCKHCYSFLMPSVNCRVRAARNKVIYYCLSCKKYTRHPYQREKKKAKYTTQK